MEVSNCTFGFCAIIQRDLRILLLLNDSPRDNRYACMILDHAGKATHSYQNCLAGLAMKKIRRYNNSPPYMMARWPSQQIPHKFPWFSHGSKCDHHIKNLSDSTEMKSGDFEIDISFWKGLLAYWKSYKEDCIFSKKGHRSISIFLLFDRSLVNGSFLL